MIDIADALARLEQPAYTGDNRCLPCTVVNVGIATVIAAAIAAVTDVPAGVAALGLFLLLIRFRGYLVPGTPALTRRYLPERVLEAFGKSPSTAPTIDTVSPGELATVLTAADVAATRGPELELAPSFRTRWNERLDGDDAAEPDGDEIASMLGVDEIERLDDASFVLEGRKRVRWESTAALAADVTAAAELRTRIDGWDALTVDERRDLLTGLRLLRDRCPACGDAVTTTAETLEHCCRRSRVGIRAVCEGCDRPLVERVVTEVGADPWLELAGVTAADDSKREP